MVVDSDRAAARRLAAFATNTTPSEPASFTAQLRTLSAHRKRRFGYPMCNLSSRALFSASFSHQLAVSSEI
jgi:hypothetical protein